MSLFLKGNSLENLTKFIAFVDLLYCQLHFSFLHEILLKLSFITHVVQNTTINYLGLEKLLNIK